MRRRKQPQAFRRSRYRRRIPAFARSFSITEGTTAPARNSEWGGGVTVRAARVHSFGRRSATTLAQSDVGKIAIHRGSCTTHTQERNRPHRNLDTVIQLLALRLATRLSAGEDNRSACIRLIQAKKSNRVYEISVPAKAVFRLF